MTVTLYTVTVTVPVMMIDQEFEPSDGAIQLLVTLHAMQGCSRTCELFEQHSATYSN